MKEEFLLIGQVKVNIESIKDKIVSIDDTLDLAVIDLSEGHNESLEDTGKMFFEPNKWPASECAVGDSIFFVGYPGVFREDHEAFTSVFYAGVNEEVMDVSDRRIYIQFNRENWIKALGVKEIAELKELGGLSGGPVFIIRDGLPELIGFIFEEMGGFLEGVQVVKSNLITADGKIDKELR